MGRETIEINTEFARALDLMENSDSHLFITGKAGTGKSTLLDHFRRTTRKEIAVLAPTGVAALNVARPDDPLLLRLQAEHHPR